MALWSLSGCAHGEGKKDFPPSYADYQKLPRIVVLPVLAYARETESGKALCPLCEEGLQTSTLKNKDLGEFYHLLYYQLEKSFRFQVLSQRSTQASLQTPEGWPGHLEALCAQAGSLKIPYFLTATLFRYDERQGDRYGVLKPAAVAFDLHLIKTADASIVWSKRYMETQASLTENVLDAATVFKRRARWLTVHELARDGLQKTLEDLPPLAEAGENPPPG